MDYMKMTKKTKLSNEDITKLIDRGEMPIYPYFPRSTNKKTLISLANPKTFDSDILFKKNNNIKKLNKFNSFKISNHSQNYKRNPFIINSMIAIGGGEKKLLDSCYDQIRIGNGTFDQLKYLNQFQALDETKINIDVFEDEIVEKYFPFCNNPELKEKILYFDEIISYIKINSDANPGQSLSSIIDDTKKGDFFPILVKQYQEIYNKWCYSSYQKKHDQSILYIQASRPKLMTIEKGLKKIEDGKALGRVINMPDSIEQFISYPIWFPLFKKILFWNRNNVFMGPLLGISRNSNQWEKLKKDICAKEWVFTSDWSTFDQTIPGNVMRMALRILYRMFDTDDQRTKRYLDHYKVFFEENIIKKRFLIREKMFIEIKNGVPSGLLMTSIITSISCLILLHVLMRRGGFDDFIIYSYGDDNIISFNVPKKIKNFRPNKLKQDIQYFSKSLFNMKNDKDGMCCVRTSKMFVNYKRPIYKPGDYLSKGTRNLKPIKYQYSNKPFTTYDHNKGTTHRWNYVFANKPNFLSYYWLEDGKPIRPLVEVAARLVNPEKTKIHYNMHVSSIISAVYDNIWNHHVINHAYFWLYDLPWLKNCTYSYKNEKRFNKKFDLQNPDNLYTKIWNEKIKLKQVKKGDRMWLRRIDYVVDERKEEVMQNHNFRFLKLIDDAQRNYYAPNSHKEDEFWEVQRNLEKLVRSKYEEEFPIDSVVKSEQDPISILKKKNEEQNKLLDLISLYENHEMEFYKFNSHSDVLEFLINNKKKKEILFNQRKKTKKKILEKINYYDNDIDLVIVILKQYYSAIHPNLLSLGKKMKSSPIYQGVVNNIINWL